MTQSDDISVSQIGPGSAVAAGRGASATIIQNIQNIQQRALTAAEEAKQARDLELELLAQGVGALAQRLQAQAASLQNGSPYRGLLAYSLSDAEIFCGREQAIRALLEHVSRAPLTVLHAESGVGKTSLLRAGIAARLIEDEHLAIYLRPYDADPGEFLKRAFLPDPRETPRLASLPLREFLQNVCSVIGPQQTLYLLLDQFEEFFALLKKPERRPFIEQLANCLNDPSLSVRWVLALRGEAFTELAEFEHYGIAPFKNAIRLNRLSRTEAYEVIIEPATRLGLTFEPKLVEAILDSLERNGEIAPTQLQLVCSALTEDSPKVRPITRERFDTRGGTEGILRDYLKQQLAQLPAEEREPAWRLLRMLVSSELRRAVRTHSEIVDELCTQGLSRKSLDVLLARLVERRLLLVQELTTDGERTYELAHDYLVREIELDPQEQARKAAQELLEQEVRTYRQYKTVIAEDRFKIVESYQNELRFTSEAAVLFKQSQAAIRQARVARERRRNGLLAGAIAVAIVMTLLGFFGLNRSQEANRQAATATYALGVSEIRGTDVARQAATAQAASAEALSRQLVAQAEYLYASTGSLYPAALLATEAMHYGTNPGAGLFLQRTLDQLPRPIGELTLTTSIQQVKLLSQGDSLIALTGEQLYGTFPLGVVLTDTQLHKVNLASQQEAWTFRQEEAITDFVTSSDGQRVLAKGAHTLTLLDTQTGRQLSQMPNDESRKFSPDLKWAATLAQTPSLQVIFHPVATLGDPIHVDIGKLPDSLTFSPDSALFLVQQGAQVLALNPANGQEIYTLLLPEMCQNLVTSPNGQFAAVICSQGKEIVVWNLTDGRILYRWNMPSDPAAGLLFTPDNRNIIIWTNTYPMNVVLGAQEGTFARAVEFRNLSTGAGIWSAELPMGGWKFHPDGRLAAFFDRNWIYIADLMRQQVVAKLDAGVDVQDVVWDSAKYPQWLGVIPAHGACSGASCVYVMQVWDIGTQKVVAQLWNRGANNLPQTNYAGNPSGLVAAWNMQEKRITLWNLAVDQQVLIEGRNLAPPDYISQLAFSPDGQWLVAGLPHKSVLVYQATDRVNSYWQPQATLPVVELSGWAFLPDSRRMLVAQKSGLVQLIGLEKGLEQGRWSASPGITALALDRQGERVVIGARDGSVTVHRLNDGAALAHTQHSSEVLESVFNPDASQLLSVDKNGELRVWRSADGQILSSFQLWNSTSWKAHFSPDSQLIAAVISDTQVAVWETAGGKKVFQQSFHDLVTEAQFSPDGRALLIAAKGEAARLWQTADFRTFVELPQLNYLKAASFDANSRYLLTAAFDGKTRVWSALTGELVAEVLQPSDLAMAVAVSPDARQAAVVGASNNTIRVIRWQPADLAQQACLRLPRNLTPAEWQLNVGNVPYHETCPAEN